MRAAAWLTSFRRVGDRLGVHRLFVPHAGGHGRFQALYALAAFILIAVYPLLSASGQRIDFFVVSLGAIPPVVFALRRVAPRDKGPWRLLLLALIVINASNVIWIAADGTPSPVARLLDASGNALILAAAVAVVRLRGRQDVGGIIDTTIVTLAFGGLLWDVLLLPRLVDEYQDGPAQLSLFIVIFALSGVLGALVRLVQNTGRGSALWWLIAGLTLAVAGNCVLAMTTAVWLRNASTMMFMAAFASIGLFGLDKNVVRLTEPTSGPPRDALSVGRLIFLGAAVAVIPVVVGARALLGASVDGLLLVLSGLIIAALVMARIGLLSAERANAEARLRVEAAHDPLTGLPNRRAFVARLRDVLSTGRTCVIVFCDLDGFKAVNDRFGHAAGDQLLAIVADRLRACVSEPSLVSRFGGDEFLILLQDMRPTDVDSTRDRIIGALSRPVELEHDQVRVSTSIGTAVATGELDPEELIRRADHAMYHAKRDVPDRNRMSIS